jgi:hypothetical protein
MKQTAIASCINYKRIDLDGLADEGITEFEL